MTDPLFRDEIGRIQAEYERRAREIPADYYSSTHGGNLFLHTQSRNAMIKILKQGNFLPLTDKKILEVGCGSGAWLIDFEAWGANQSQLYGIDLNGDRLANARQRLPQADLRIGEASALPWEDETFDLVLQSTLFTSILNSNLKQKIAGEMLRVLKPCGVILWYDFFYNNPKNSNVRGIGKKEIQNLFPGSPIRFQRITLGSPIARWLAPYSWRLCYLLEKMGFLNTHYLARIGKSDTTPR